MDNRTLFGVMTLILNCYGIPLFLIGKTKEGVKRIIFGIISFGIIAIINEIKGIIKGIEILKMTDEEFAATDKETLIVGIPALK